MENGKVVQVLGPVVDVEFSPGWAARDLHRPHGRPTRAIDDSEDNLVLEVAQHLGENTVRTIAMDTTDGLIRGQEVTNTGDVNSASPVGPRNAGTHHERGR